MATQTQPLASRLNAPTRTGPSAPAVPVLPHENRDDFNELEAAYRAEFNPQTPHEKFTLGEMVQARWKLDRIRRLEALAFEQMLTEPGSDNDPDARILAAIGRSGNAFDKLQRYASAATRAYNTAHRELKRSLSERTKTQAQSAQAFINQYLDTPKPPKHEKSDFQNEPNCAPAAAVRPNLALRL